MKGNFIILMNQMIALCFYDLKILGWLLAEVVAQAVEKRHSVLKSTVQIPRWTWTFFSSELLSIYSHWASGFF